MTQIFFYIMAATVVGGALGVVLVRSVVYAALFLVMSLLGVAGVYLLLSVEFLALVQVLVYSGAVMLGPSVAPGMVIVPITITKQ